MPPSLQERAKALKERLQGIFQQAQQRQQAAVKPIPPAVKSREDDEMRRAQHDLQQLTDLRQNELAKVQQSIQNSPIVGQHDDGGLLLQRQRCFQSELQAMRSHLSATPGPLPAAAQLGRTYDDLNRICAELQECIRFQQQENEQLQNDIEREERLLKERTKQANELETKTLRNDGSNSEEQLRAKISTLQQCNMKNMKKLSDFIDANFPTPSAPQKPMRVRRKQQPNQQDEQVEQPQQLMPLKLLLQDLMNAIVTRPNDPYITLHEQHWPPFVELLIRAGIAVKHPQSSDMVKLTEFHR